MSRLDRVVFDPDVTAPSIPVLATPVVFDQTRLDLSWTSATDTESGIGGYDVLIDSTTLVNLGIQTSYSATGFVASSTHTFRVRARDGAGNLSGFSNQVSGTTAAAPSVYNPTFPRLASYATSGQQNYADAAVIAAMALRHINIVSHYPGWQQSSTKGNGTSMATVCAQVKAQSTIGTKMFPYIIYSEVAKVNVNPGNAFWETYQHADQFNLWAYTNGVAETGQIDSSAGSQYWKMNFTTSGKLVNGKTWTQWMIDWSKGLNYSGATISNGSSNLTAANNPNWDGTFFDNVFWQERSPAADYDRNGTVDSLTSTASRTLIQGSHAAAGDYFLATHSNQMVLANSADWFQAGSGFSTSPINQKFHGGVIESGVGRPGSPETSGSFQQYMDSIKGSMDWYAPPKLGVIVNYLPSYTDYRNMRYSLGACLLTDAYCYQASGGSNPSQDLPTTWYDEYAFNLGTPVDPVQTAPRYNIEAGGTGGGVWRRDFANGIVLVGGRRGNGSLASFDQETAYASVALGATFFRLVGTQDTTTNSGASLSSISLKPRDAIVLRRTSGETIAPSVPGSLSATAGVSSINLTWNASTDTGGSGLAGYKLERSVSASSGFAQISTPTATSATDGTAIAGTPYFYRVRAYDNAGNNSGYSNVASATIASNLPPVWATVPLVSFTQGSAGTFSLAPYVSDPNSDPLTLTKNAIALPSGVTFDGPNKRYVYDGVGAAASTTGHIVTASDTSSSAETDWLARAGAAGILRAIRFVSLADVQANTLQDAQADHVVFDSTIKHSGSGSARFNILNTDGTSSGGIRLYLSPTQQLFGNGSEYYVQWSQYLPAAFCNGLFPGDSNSIDGIHSNGFKQAICSHFSGSNQNNEVVIENTFQMGCPLAYHQDGNSFAQFSMAWSSACNGADYRFQNAVDNGGTVTNCPEAYARWGPMYSSTKYTGTPFAGNGGVPYTPDVWMTFMVRVKMGTLGSANSTFEAWAAVSGQSPRKAHTYIGNVLLGTGNSGHNALWLLPYQTGKVAGVGYDTFTCYDEVLTGTLPIPFPGGFTVTPG